MRNLCSSTRCFVVVLSCLAGAFAGSAAAQEKITLKLNLKKGDQRKMNFTMDMNNTVSVNEITLDMKMTMGMDMTVNVKDVDADGVHTMAFTYDRIKMKMSGPINVDFDSANENSGNDPLGKVFGALAGQTITTVMAPDGKVQEVQGFEELAEKLGVPKGQLKGQGDQMTQMMAALPTKPVGIGDSWEGTMKMASDPNLPATVTAKYTLTDRQEGDAIVKLDGTIKSDQGLNGTMSGTMRIDEQTGWTKNGTMEMKMKGNVQGGASIDMDGTITFGEAMQN